MGDSNGTKRKMVIKPFKKKPKVPDNFEQGAWDKLREAIVAVQKNQTIQFSREDLYRSVEDMCKWKLADRYVIHLSYYMKLMYDVDYTRNCKKFAPTTFTIRSKAW